MCLSPQGINGKCVKVQISHAYLNLNLNVRLYLNLYFNIKRLNLGTIDSHEGVQRRIFSMSRAVREDIHKTHETYEKTQFSVDASRRAKTRTSE